MRRHLMLRLGNGLAERVQMEISQNRLSDATQPNAFTALVHPRRALAVLRRSPVYTVVLGLPARTTVDFKLWTDSPVSISPRGVTSRSGSEDGSNDA